MSEISDKVRAMVAAHIGDDISRVTENANFSTDLGLDSLDVADLSMEFEKEFNYTVDPEEEPHIETVADAIAYIEKKIAEQGK